MQPPQRIMARVTDNDLICVRRVVFMLLDILTSIKTAAQENDPVQVLARGASYLAWTEAEWSHHELAVRSVVEELESVRTIRFRLQGGQHGSLLTAARGQLTATGTLLRLAAETIGSGTDCWLVSKYWEQLKKRFPKDNSLDVGNGSAAHRALLRDEVTGAVRLPAIFLLGQVNLNVLGGCHVFNLLAFLRSTLAEFDDSYFAREMQDEFRQAHQTSPAGSPTGETDTSNWWTVKKTAQVVGKSESTISRYVDNGKLRGNGQNKARRIDPASVAEYLETHPNAGEKPETGEEVEGKFKKLGIPCR
jgi:hypothetical protein